MPGQFIYHCQVRPEWIDYNGHLRDGYYALILSFAIDALMDRLGLDEAYRTRSRATLYTLEMHMHFLHEVRQTDAVAVDVSILEDYDACGIAACMQATAERVQATGACRALPAGTGVHCRYFGHGPQGRCAGNHGN
jgi:acyl-CoA thioesterase FadM